MRALVILTSLFFGCGAAFYGMAWFLLPDETDDRILCEELIAGHWDWSCIGVFVCMAIAICLPGAGWVAFAVAALILWLIVNRQTYAPAWQQQAQYGPVPHNPYVLGAQGAAGPMPPQAPPFVATMDGPKPVSPWYQRGMPQQQGVPPYDSVYRQGPAGGTGDVPPQAHVSQQPMNGPAAFATANVPPTFTAPAAPIEPQPRYGRRKPAGPFLVLMTFGLALLAVAGLYWYDTFDGSKTSQNIIADKLQVTTLVAGGFCLLMGVIYLLVTLMGVWSRGALEAAPNGGTALAQIAQHYLGKAGLLVLAATVTLACLKTAVGLITSCAETFVGMFPKGLSYRNWVFVFTGISFLLANVGLTAIITYAVPVLMFLYPLAITLILLALLGHFFDHDRAVYVWVTGLTLVAAFYDLLRTLPDHLRAVLHVNGLVDTVGKALPFATIGLGWICPAILGLVIGLIFRAVRPKKA